MGNTFNSEKNSAANNGKGKATVIYISDKLTPAHHKQKPIEKMTQLKQPKKAGLFKTKKSSVSVTQQSEVDRIMAGMQRNTK